MAGRDRAGRRVGLSVLALAGAGALALLLLVYVVLRLMLASSGDTPSTRLAALNPEARLTLSRPAAAMPAAASAQASKLRRFPGTRNPRRAGEGGGGCADGSRAHDHRTAVPVGSDELEPGRETLFHRIGRAIEDEKGGVVIEGHADNTPVATVRFPDNMALSEARAETVAKLIRSDLSDPSRVTIKGLEIPCRSPPMPMRRASRKTVGSRSSCRGVTDAGLFSELVCRDDHGGGAARGAVRVRTAVVRRLLPADPGADRRGGAGRAGLGLWWFLRRRAARKAADAIAAELAGPNAADEEGKALVAA